MYTICETPLFTKYCLVYWTQEEYEEFKTFLALNPDAGDVVIYAELSGDFPLGDSRQPTYKSLRPFDLVS